MNDVKQDLSRPYCKVYYYDIDGKRYYGFTGQSIENRHKQHLHNAIGYVDDQKSSKLYTAWRRSKNQKTIRPKVLAKDLNMIEALLTESYCIFLDQTNKSGLNTTPGGESGDIHIKYLAKPEEVKLIWGKDAYRFYDIMQVELPIIVEDKKKVKVQPHQTKWRKVCDLFKFDYNTQKSFMRAPTQKKQKVVRFRRLANTAKKEKTRNNAWKQYWNVLHEIQDTY